MTFGENLEVPGANIARASAEISMPEGEPTVNNSGLTPDEVLAVIRANIAQPRTCYQELLKRQPDARGKMIVGLTIGVDGRVRTAQVADSTINDGLMRGCLTSKLKSMKFPNPRGEEPVKVQYPFTFAPN